MDASYPARNDPGQRVGQTRQHGPGGGASRRAGADQPDLFSPGPINGPEQTGDDHARQSTQRLAVWALMRDGTWWTLADLTEAIGTGSEAGVSARIRDFRKPKYGGHTVDKRRVVDGGGTWEYRLEGLR